MVQEHVYVNTKSYSVSVPIPNGSSFNVMPNNGVRGEHFARVVALSGCLTPLSSLPANVHKKFLVHDPLGVGTPKSEALPSQAEVKPANKRAAKNAPKTTEVVQTQTAVVASDATTVEVRS